jgi:serine/threonine-protein kinase
MTENGRRRAFVGMKVASGISVSAVAGGQATGGPREPSAPIRKIGKYTILRKVGSGGFGSVYEARDPFIQRTVAVKTCELQDPEVQDRFFQEAQLGGSLRHRNVTTVYDFGIEQGLPYMVEEFLDGEDLDRLIEDNPNLPLIEKLQILIGIAYGLEYTHNAGIVHHDVKPGNVRVLADGTVKLMDFGIARSMQSRPGIRRATGVGTWAYLAPERITRKPLDQRTDVFSFGVLAYELLSGRRPFEGTTQEDLLDRIVSQEPEALQEIASEVPPALAAIVGRAMQKDPARRYPGIEPMRQELLAIARDLFGLEGFAQARRAAPTILEIRPGERESRAEFNTQELRSREARTSDPSPSTAFSGQSELDEEAPETHRRTRLWAWGLTAAALLLAVAAFLVVTRTPSAPKPAAPAGLPIHSRAMRSSAASPAAADRRGEPAVPNASAPAAEDSGPGKDASRAGYLSPPSPAQETNERKTAEKRPERPVRREVSAPLRAPSMSRYAKAAQEPGLSTETRAATGVAGAWESYQSGDMRTARDLLRLAFSWRRDLAIDPKQYSPGFSRLAEEVRSGR